MQVDPKPPVTIALLDMTEEIKLGHLKQVTSPMVRESSSNSFHPGGLFSEVIFGQIATPARLITEGYVDLRCTIFHPRVYDALIRLNRLFGEVMAGVTYVMFDEPTKTLVRVDEDDPRAKTGFHFFMSVFPKLNIERNTSMVRENRIKLLEMYKSTLTMDKLMVLPAGLRDIKLEEAMLESDDVNGLYRGVLAYAMALPEGRAIGPIYDPVRYALQKKVAEVFDYIYEILAGKTGYLESKYMKRQIAYGTRNVISSSMMAAPTSDHPQFHKFGETKIPLIQACGAFRPIVVYQLRSLMVSSVMDQSSDKVSAIDPDTLALTYITVSDEEKNRFMTSDGLIDLMDICKDDDQLWEPVTIGATDGKRYYLHLTYKRMVDDKIILHTFRSVEDLKRQLAEKKLPFVPTQVRPMTYCEMVYIAAQMACNNKYGTQTRYPVAGIMSAVPIKVHLMSTEPADVVYLVPLGSDSGVMLPEYPIHKGSMLRSMALHPATLVGHTADFDGDQMSMYGALAEETNQEFAGYQQSLHATVSDTGTMMMDHKELVHFTLANLSVAPVAEDLSLVKVAQTFANSPMNASK